VAPKRWQRVHGPGSRVRPSVRRTRSRVPAPAPLRTRKRRIHTRQDATLRGGGVGGPIAAAGFELRPDGRVGPIGLVHGRRPPHVAPREIRLIADGGGLWSVLRRPSEGAPSHTPHPTPRAHTLRAWPLADFEPVYRRFRACDAGKTYL
jgi:hypothetical protein